MSLTDVSRFAILQQHVQVNSELLDVFSIIYYNGDIFKMY